MIRVDERKKKNPTEPHLLHSQFGFQDVFVFKRSTACHFYHFSSHHILGSTDQILLYEIEAGFDVFCLKFDEMELISSLILFGKFVDFFVSIGLENEHMWA